ncbi:hypothetical protein FACS18948_4170 [Clostridia bacterium]|nr:hypothetical protein FACS18948_4170 [Clostridia bacterium]
MILQKSMFFNSSNSDRLYNAADFASYFGKLVSNGIFYGSADNLRVSIGSGMGVSIAAGSAWANGYCYENTDTFALTLPTANGANPRIDRIVVRWSLADRSMILAVLTGAPSSIPAAPTLTRSNEVYELCLADILIPKSSITVVATNIIDTRLDPTLCGLINSLVSAVYE